MAAPIFLRMNAARLRRNASELETLLNPVIARTGPNVWSGVAADEFDVQLRIRKAALAMSAQELRAAAGRLEAQADRAERSHLALVP